MLFNKSDKLQEIQYGKKCSLRYNFSPQMFRFPKNGLLAYKCHKGKIIHLHPKTVPFIQNISWKQSYSQNTVIYGVSVNKCDKFQGTIFQEKSLRYDFCPQMRRIPRSKVT